MKKAILFVHGLGGGKSFLFSNTWGKFETLIEEDEELNYDTYFYDYNTSVFGIFSSYQGISSLAIGLSSYIKMHLNSKYDEIILVGHSLGGLVIREYLLEKSLKEQETKFTKIAFYAVPNDGSGLADISSFISWNRQLKQLCRDSEFITKLNHQWFHENMNMKYEYEIIYGADDGIVSENSSIVNFREFEPVQIQFKGHKSIVKPEDSNDESFIVLKNFLLKKN